MKEKRVRIWARVLEAFNQSLAEEDPPKAPWPLVKLQDLRRRELRKGQASPDAAR